MPEFLGTYPRRGEVYWFDFGDPVGSEPASGRPSLVVSRDAGNRTGSVVIIAVMSRSGRDEYPEHVRLPDGLGVQGFVHCGQLVTVSKERLRDFAASLDPLTMYHVDRALAVALGLPIRT
ncbi:MAG: type II toxin-antitoxin system PemK/MazF family toxin [Acidimicrobiia bacterium]